MDYLARAGLADKVRFEVGEALEVMDRLEGSFDLIFNDIDKEDYGVDLERAGKSDWSDPLDYLDQSE